MANPSKKPERKAQASKQLPIALVELLADLARADADNAILVAAKKLREEYREWLIRRGL